MRNLTIMLGEDGHPRLSGAILAVVGTAAGSIAAEVLGKMFR